MDNSNNKSILYNNIRGDYHSLEKEKLKVQNIYHSHNKSPPEIIGKSIILGGYNIV